MATELTLTVDTVGRRARELVGALDVAAAAVIDVIDRGFTAVAAVAVAIAPAVFTTLIVTGAVLAFDANDIL